jgi:hypothetical protein
MTGNKFIRWIEKVAEDGKVITDKIKSIIFESMLMNIMPLTKKKPKMKMVLRIQRSVLLTFDFNFFDFTLVFIIVKSLKVRNDELELFGFTIYFLIFP